MRLSGAKLLKRAFDLDLQHGPKRGGEETLRALELDAIDFVAKPKIDRADGLRLLAEDITDKCRIAAQAQLRKPASTVAAGSASASPKAAAPSAFGRLTAWKIIFIGASTGGTEATKGRPHHGRWLRSADPRRRFARAAREAFEDSSNQLTVISGANPAKARPPNAETSFGATNECFAAPHPLPPQITRIADMNLRAASQPSAGSAPLAAVATALRKFLAFELGPEEYGIDILRVQEIRSYEEPTRIANAPPFVKGVVNQRGVIVPIADMRLKFNLEQVGYDGLTVVIVHTIGNRVIGMVVDAVSGVITLTPEQLRPVPEFNSAIASDHLLAIGAIEQRRLILMDIEKLMSSAETGLVEQTLQ